MRFVCFTVHLSLLPRASLLPGGRYSGLAGCSESTSEHPLLLQATTQ